MPLDKKRKQLKIETLPEDDNMLEQLVASLRRIEQAMSNILQTLEAWHDDVLERPLPATWPGAKESGTTLAIQEPANNGK